jgi:hypothetical protein
MRRRRHHLRSRHGLLALWLFFAALLSIAIVVVNLLI